MDVLNASASSLFGLDEPICPYTGLRTFTEGEAIYFRGRERHVAKCLALLAEQRFVMITGTSGDGKSSLVFAGMLPEVRAGFLRARHSNWAVAAFRPERSPLRNLSQALATALRLPSSISVETELEQGFSALVQLYKTSELSPAVASPEGLAPAERRQYQRQAANLLLVVDQFEEFFTNPENYVGDAPTTAAQTVVNLLLETARLAQAENLPIYIVCTMRSDFVGQCAEFRGLIEQVGASQYFVPRLLRHEFVEVIKEPAVLSGNRISERLVQRLLYDIGQGQDQLPVLQHALRRIWLAADEGREEMDLLHYAMVGGLSDELPAAHQARFAAWRTALPAHQQEFLLAKSSLRNVLDAHANQLYFEANDLYNANFEPPLPPGTAERVIEQTFRVLTRTDGKRVVRSRVTGAQITAILQDEALPWLVVCRILRPFRAAGTTFLSPFLGDDEDDRAVLPPETVLDITHESLIRNWNYLAEWAASEAKDVLVAKDFQRQASRWQDNAESRGFLLPIGLYTFFSQWHTNKKGADGWLAFYLEATPGGLPRPESVSAQNSLLMRYLQTSRRYLWSQLLAARHGAWRLVAAVLLPLLLAGLAWGWWTQRQKQSDFVAEKLVQSGLSEFAQSARSLKERARGIARVRRRLEQQFARNNAMKTAQTSRQMEQNAALTNSAAAELTELSEHTLPMKDMARFLLNADRLKDVVYRPWFSSRQAADYAFPQMLTALKDDTLALDIELNLFAIVDNLDYDGAARENPYMQPVLLDLEQRLARAGGTANPAMSGPVPLSEPHRRVAVLMARTIMALSYYLACDAQRRPEAQPNPVLQQAARAHFEQSRLQLLQKLRAYAQQEVLTTTGTAPSPAAFGFCLRVLLGQGAFKPAELAFLNGLSPFEPAGARQFDRLFPPNLELYAPNSISNQLSHTPHSGGYLTAAIVFAALRQPAQLTQCLDTLRAQAVRNAALNEAVTAFGRMEANSTIALLPYLVKYELFSPQNTYELLAKCAQASRLPFNELYAATVYSLLSVQPVQAVFDVTQTPTNTAQMMRGVARLGGINLEYLNADRVSFSLPMGTRDKAWAALLGATKEISQREAIFIALENSGRLAAALSAYYAKRNELFLSAFLAKMRVGYLGQIKGQPNAAAQSFARFSNLLGELTQCLQQGPAAQEAKATAAVGYSGPERINSFHWNLIPHVALMESGKRLLSTGTQNPLTFLRLPLRPKTLAFGAYYTCSFDAFFRYELQYEARRAQPDRAVVRLLDSLAFWEAAFPDRFSNSRTSISYYSALERPARHQPNLAWIRAVAETDIPAADNARHPRNALLLALAEAVHSRRKLSDSTATRRLVSRLLRSARQVKLGPHPACFTLPLRVAFSDLATAMARQGRVAEAFALSDSVRYMYELYYNLVSTKIRASEQAMLTNNQRAMPLLNGFLSQYLAYNQAGVISINKDNAPAVAASILPMCFWRPQVTDQADTISLIAPSLTYQLNNELLVSGLYAPFKAYGLSDKLCQANREMADSPFILGFTLLKDINYILLGYAHLKTTTPDDGWLEYDEGELTSPADYHGSHQ